MYETADRQMVRFELDELGKNREKRVKCEEAETCRKIKM